MIYVDCKVTIWHRFRIEDEAKEELMEFLNQNPEATNHDVLTWAEERGYASDHETLHDTGCEMTPEENNGGATLEINQFFPEQPEVELWNNAIKEPS